MENKFYNPVKQNKSHIYQLSQILPSNIKIHSLVVFTKNNTQHIKSSAVCSVYDIRARLKHEEEKSLSTKEILQVSQILFENKNDKLSKRKHIKNIKKMLKDIENNICPRCESELILKNGKYGEFYGCSNYPNCKFTKKKEE